MNTLESSMVDSANAVSDIWRPVRTMVHTRTSWDVVDTVMNVTHSNFAIPLHFEDFLYDAILERLK